MRTTGVAVVPAYVARDLANLRRAFPEDGQYARAIIAVASEIQRALAAPRDFGIELDRELDSWRRSKFPSKNRETADLRLIFRAAGNGGIQILAFGDRQFPDSVYYTAKERAL
ncbi:MAG TPA: hypothetical protein VMF11_14560 [Candidatus Baltobacteraceae bacterium]|nr:hypothetical protein [Candidatus Baltobacteraceae bacterium]